MTIRLAKMIALILSLTWFSAVAKAAPGDLDLTFNGTGKVTTDVGTGVDIGRGTAVQADGKIIIVGSAFNAAGTNSDIGVVRYNADGSLDTSFDGDGKVITALFTRNDDGYAAAIQPDGKILVVATYQYTNSNSNRLGALIRYNTDGSFDTSFDGDGFAQVLMENVTSLVIQPDGKIIVAGSQVTGTSAGQARQQRFNPNGSVDTTFGNGIAGAGTNAVQYDTFTTTSHDARTIALQPDGKIIVGGCRASGTCIYGLARLNADGSLDTSFDGDGRVTTDGGGSIEKLIIQPDGKIVAVGGLVVAGSPDFNVTRYNANGSLDSSFGTDGRVSTNFLGSDSARAGALQPDGKIVVGGTTGGVDPAFAIARYTSAGALDPTFSGDGKQTVDFGTAAEIAVGLALDSSGRMVISGYSNNLFAVARVTGDSSSVPTARKVLDFDGDGKTDFAVTRAANASSPSTWYISGTGGANSFVQFGLGVRGFGFANGTDVATPADFDGDGKTDIAVFRRTGYGDPAYSYFFILQSNGNVFRSEQFGTTGDNPTIVDDYDADGKADLAVWREGATAGAQSVWYYRPSASPGVDFRGVAWGTRGDFVAPGDYGGHGKADICIYRPLSGGNGQYILNRSSDSGVEYVNWGLGTDQINPGDYDGDGKTDFMITRNVGGSIFWYLLTRTGSTSVQQFGVFSSDFTAQGDYDGDGKTDIAIWRNSANAAFYVQRSSAGFQTFQWGLQGDYPVAYYNAH